MQLTYYRKRLYRYFFKNYSSKRYPRKKVRKFRRYLEKLPFPALFLWAKKKFKQAKDNKGTYRGFIPTVTADSWRVDLPWGNLHLPYSEDDKHTAHYLSCQQRNHLFLMRRVRRASLNLYRIIPWAVRVDFFSYKREWEKRQLGLRKTHPIRQNWSTAHELYHNGNRNSYFYASLRQQWLYHTTAWRSYFAYSFSPLMHSEITFIGWSYRLLRRTPNIFTVIDRFIYPLSNRFKRFSHYWLLPYQQLWQDLLYLTDSIQEWHNKRYRDYKTVNRFYDSNYYAKFFPLFDKLEYELAEFNLKTKLRVFSIRLKYFFFKLLLLAARIGFCFITGVGIPYLILILFGSI